MNRNYDYYISKGFDDITARYFANGKRKAVKVSVMDNYKLFITFDNGEERVYDASSLFAPGSVFLPLKELDKFKNAYVDENGAVAWNIDPAVDSAQVWNNKLDLSSDTLYLNSWVYPSY